MNSSPSTAIGFGQRIGASISSYSLPIYNLGSTPTNLQADCSGEALFGMYADLSSGCSSYHVCHGGRRDTFTCPEGTLFSQELMTCDYWYRVSCGSNGESYSPPQQQPPPPPPPPQASPPQQFPPQGYYPSWSSQPSIPQSPQPQQPSDFIPSTGSYNPSGSFPVFPQFPQSPYSPSSPSSPPTPYQPPSPGTYPSLSPPSSPPVEPSSERERPETEEEPRTIRPPTGGYNPFDPPSSSGPNLPVPVAPNQPQYPQYPQYQPPSGYPQLPGSYSPSSPPSAGGPPSQQPPYSFNDWNQDEPEWTYAWMKKSDQPTDQITINTNGQPENNNRSPSEPSTGLPFDFSLVNEKLGGSAAIKERSDSPSPWLFPINNLYKKA